MSRATKLALGTVQWGLEYGVSNRHGKTLSPEVSRILDMAKEKGVTLLDTAPAYGNAEHVLGQTSAASNGFRVVTKTIPISVSGAITEEDVDTIRKIFLSSLQNIGGAGVYGLLVHRADNLLVPGGKRVWGLLQEFKDQKCVEKIGVSVYNPEQLEKILEHYSLDLVQLPLNLYDQRFVRTGLLRQLVRAGIEVHVRSVFLQGLLLMEPGKLPIHFDIIREQQMLLHQATHAAGFTVLAACIRFCLDMEGVHKVIVGVENSAQFSEILNVTEGVAPFPSGLKDIQVEDESIINPSLWPK